MKSQSCCENEVCAENTITPPLNYLTAKALYLRGMSEFNGAFDGNASRVDSWIAGADSLLRIKGIKGVGIEISGYASRDGSFEANLRLAQKRAARMAEYLKSVLPAALDALPIKAQGCGIDSASSLTEARKCLISLIYTAPQATPTPESKCVSDQSALPANQKESEAISEESYVDNVESEAPAKSEKQEVFAFRTNLLLPALNIGVELPIGNRWSLSADWYYPFFPRRSNHKEAFQVLYGAGEVRYWFGNRDTRPRLTGHSIGINGGGGIFDVGHNYKGHRGSFYSVGLDYLYSFRLGKGPLRMELGAGIGYIGATAEPYKVLTPGGRLFRSGNDKRFRYFGPTRASVNLVLPLYKSKK